MNDTIAASTGYKVQLDVFEGPLDLLLHLVKKHELDIIDIPISFVTEKYLEYLDMMKALNLDVAGEYLLMAATLAFIKSRELLPNQDVGEDEEVGEEDEIDPRQELIRRLLQYQKYKDAAANLASRPVVGRNVWMRGCPQEEALAETVDADIAPPLAEFPVHKLIAALERLLEKAKIKMTHDVTIDRLSLSEAINHLTDRLDSEGRFSFRSCFRFLREEVTVEEARHEAVVTFLAILEMAKLGILAIAQPKVDDEYDDEIYLTRSSAAGTAEDGEPARVEAVDDYR